MALYNPRQIDMPLKPINFRMWTLVCVWKDSMLICRPCCNTNKKVLEKFFSHLKQTESKSFNFQFGGGGMWRKIKFLIWWFFLRSNSKLKPSYWLFCNFCYWMRIFCSWFSVIDYCICNVNVLLLILSKKCIPSHFTVEINWESSP